MRDTEASQPGDHMPVDGQNHLTIDVDPSHLIGAEMFDDTGQACISAKRHSHVGNWFRKTRLFRQHLTDNGDDLYDADGEAPAGSTSAHGALRAHHQTSISLS